MFDTLVSDRGTIVDKLVEVKAKAKEYDKIDYQILGLFILTLILKCFCAEIIFLRSAKIVVGQYQLQKETSC